MRSDSPALAPTFRSRTQGELLALVLLQPQREWTVSELAKAIQTPLTTVQGEISRLISAGLLSDRKVGRTRLVRPNSDSPAVSPLTQLTLVTFGPQYVIGEEFAPLAADQVLVYGDWAARYEGEPGPFPCVVDVLVVGDSLADDNVEASASRSATRLGIPVTTEVRTLTAWQNAADDPLIARIRMRPSVDVTRAIA